LTPRKKDVLFSLWEREKVMKKFCAAKTKYYKTSNASGELGHVNRLFSENKNVLDGDHLKNFGDGDLLGKFKAKLIDAETDKGKKFQANSNTYIDQVLIFSSDRVEEIIARNGYKIFSEGMTKLIRGYQQRLKEEQGFEPLGFNFHMDEGHKDPETGKIKYNYHAHAIFLNYDFTKKIQPLRKLTRADFAKQQDFLADVMKRGGFERGTPKAQTGAEHREKADHVTHIRKQAEVRAERAKARVLELENDVARLTLLKRTLKREIVSGFKKFAFALKKYVISVIRVEEENKIKHDAKVAAKQLENISQQAARYEAALIAYEIDVELKRDGLSKAIESGVSDSPKRKRRRRNRI